MGDYKASWKYGINIIYILIIENRNFVNFVLCVTLILMNFKEFKFFLSAFRPPKKAKYFRNSNATFDLKICITSS